LKESTTYLEPLSPAERGSLAGSVEAREARLATVALADENAALRQEVDERGTQVRQLTVALASVQAEADLFKAELERAELGMQYPAAGSDILLEEDIQVLDVSRKLRMVILDAGVLCGIKPGMAFTIVRGKTLVGSVRAVDVRKRLCGAAIEEVRLRMFPEKGDRAVPHRSSDH